MRYRAFIVVALGCLLWLGLLLLLAIADTLAH